ncbi:AGE family epimerase/isomerase [Salinisphaera aquimarina]
MAFYHPACIDPTGGFFHFLRDDGVVYDASTRHLVSSTRFVFNYAMAFRRFAEPAYYDAVVHGVDYLRRAHRNPESGGYAWVLRDGEVDDATNHCYGLAFVLLAYAKALDAGMQSARDHLEETWQLLERHFWDAEHGLYRDEASADWQVSAYRGQNANMHACEALIAAYEASGEDKYLQRACRVADNMVNRQARLAGGWIWEHYDAHWRVDWEYNKNDFSNIFKPWGFQPGHQTEWAKLLLILDRHAPAAWRLPRACALFDTTLEHAWDDVHGGIVYGLDTDNRFYDADKYFWVQAESLATAAVLGTVTGDDHYWQWYDRIWDYSWRHFVDHRHGAWYRILGRDNRKYSDEKSPAGKVDYHTMGACYEVLGLIE